MHTDKPANLPKNKKPSKQTDMEANSIEAVPNELGQVPTLDTLNPRQFVVVKGARMHNLKGVSVAIPRNKMVVITGLSGSGKSSLAFDTIYAEGQRMYVESLSSYARQFMTRMEKPEVEYIRGLSPAIAIEQKVATKNPRSTVGTTTEIYDYLKLLFARIGTTISPVSGQPVRKDSVADVVDFIMALPASTRLMITTTFGINKARKAGEEMQVMLQKGFSRLVYNGEVKLIEDLLDEKPSALKVASIRTLIDRYVVQETTPEEDIFRLSDSVQTAFFEGDGTCEIQVIAPDGLEPARQFSDKFELDGIVFEEPTVNLFSFNNPYGACRTCDGFGKVLGIDPDLVVPDGSLSVYDGAIAPWRGDGMREEFLKPLLKNGIKFDFPIHRPYGELTDQHKQILWNGNAHFVGLHGFFAQLETQTHKIQYRVLLSRFRGRTDCPDCRGTRLRKDAGYVRIAGMGIQDLVLMPVDKLQAFFATIAITDYERTVAKQILREINARLEYLNEVGLGYLTLNRLASTLSGGEFQRIRLSTSLGSALVGSLYVLDEPSIGLHPRDTQRLIKVLMKLRNLGNTVLVVEHEEEIMRAADQLIDIGPGAGLLGGNLVFQGRLGAAAGSAGLQTWSPEQGYRDLKPTDALAKASPTVQYLFGLEGKLALPIRRQSTHKITIRGARENNLKNITVSFPLGVFTCVTGVSGSGKSTLISKILYPAMARLLGQPVDENGRFDALEGDTGKVTQIEYVDQNPIGKSSRSNPVTFTKAWDLVRTLFSELPLAKQRGYTPAHYSFNVDGGRCEACQGEGVVKVEMQFMADLYLTCEACGGKRFKQEVLEVEFQGQNVHQVLDMTVDQAMEFFATKPRIAERIAPLQKVGLGYVKLGQSSNTLSGGEAQRVKLASFLGKGNAMGHILFVFDEPTTGLHPLDVAKLLSSINALVDAGHTVLVIEHNMDMIAAADWIIDIGPEGGENGGNILFEGTPEAMAKAVMPTKVTNTKPALPGYTAPFLAARMED